MATNECRPFFKPGHDVTGYLTEPLSGKRAVATVTGSRGSQPYIGKPAAGKAIFGVLIAAGIKGDTLTVFVGGVVPVIAGAELTPGIEVEVDANGAFIPLATGVAVGYVVAGASVGNAAAVKLYG